MPLKISLHTSTREQLLDLARHMAAAVEDTALANAAQPVVVSMRGSFSCGKKIFPDMCREVLGADDKSESRYAPALYSRDEKGRTMYAAQIHKKGGFVPKEAEFWSGRKDGTPVEVQLIDAGYTLEGSTPMPSAIREWEQTKKNFLRQRAAAGVTFISNDEKGAEAAGIDLWLQSKRSPVVMSAEKDRAGKSPLAAQFNASSNAWSRYIEITVTDERLLNAPRFMQFIERLKDPAQGYRQLGPQKPAQKLLAKLTRKPTVSVAEV